MRFGPRFLFSILAFAGLALLTGCHHKTPMTVPSVPAAKTAPAPMPRKEVTESFPTQAPAPSAPQQASDQGLERIHFAFDKYELTPEDRQELRHNAQWLRAHPTDTIEIAGNCDERGTVAYNLALGESRAQAARSYLISLGIDTSRIRIVTFGKERPLDPAHDEQAWAKNRRDDFTVIVSGGA